MKRSEMIRFIQDALWCHLPHIKSDNYYENSKHIAEAIMQTVEGGNPKQSGMLPPEYNQNEGSGQYGIPSQYVNEWEFEGEKNDL